MSRVLQQLSVETRLKLRSTQILTSLTQIISELLQNSLDAGARQIDIGVDCEEWTCWVRDDGAGISKSGLEMIGQGSEEGRYNTSKAYQPASLDVVSTFGFRGEALASAADLSCLEISSRTSRSRESWSVILKGGKTLYQGPSVRWRRETAGTVVCIRDAFFNLPIRRMSHPSPNRTLETVRQELEAYALVFPGVSFSLEDTRKSRQSGSSKSHILRIPKTRSNLAAFRHIYGKALTEHVEEIDATSGDLKIDGFISLVGAHSKSYQFLYINRHPISPCDLHRVVDSTFATSSFMKHAYDEEGETNVRSAVRRSPRKAERRPVYVLNLTIPPQHIDNCLEPAKSNMHLENKNAVSTFLTSVIRSFLVRHNFLPVRQLEAASRRYNDASPSPKKKQRIETSHGDSPDRDSIQPFSEVRGDPSPAPCASLHINPGHDNEDQGGKIIWTDPTTGEIFVVDSRTGNSYPQHGPISEDHGEGGFPRTGRRTLVDTSWLKAGKDPGVGEGSGPLKAVPEWLDEALKANQAYALTEPKIPSLPQSANIFTELQGHDETSGQRHSCHGQTHPSPFFQIADSRDTSSVQARFRKEALSSAEIINQVDRKFIACLIDEHATSDPVADQLGTRPEDTPSSKVLVLIDQHAADERVRVERYLKQLCSGYLRHQEGADGVELREIDPHMPVLLTRREASRLADMEMFRKTFEAWGILFRENAAAHSLVATDAQEEENGNVYVQVFVRAVPEVLGDKLLAGDELRAVIKGFLARLEAEGRDFSFHSERENECEDGEFGWIKALRWCPRELLELINSKACRGAIMFNDTLTLDQCERLVHQLSKTAFPFQCAHGRPSLVPLTCVLTELRDMWIKSRVDWGQLACLKALKT